VFLNVFLTAKMVDHTFACIFSWNFQQTNAQTYVLDSQTASSKDTLNCHKVTPYLWNKTAQLRIWISLLISLSICIIGAINLVSFEAQKYLSKFNLSVALQLTVNVKLAVKFQYCSHSVEFLKFSDNHNALLVNLSELRRK
jgi:hypothetical protein